MTVVVLTVRPTYDLHDGLGRRRRLRQLGIDPDKPVQVVQDHIPQESHENENDLKRSA